MSKFERDLVGAASLIAELGFGENPVVREAAEHARRKVGITNAQWDGPEQEPVDATPPEEKTSPGVSHVVGGSSSGGMRFFCVFHADGSYSGRSFASPHQAASFCDTLEEGAYMRKLSASDIPEG